jgi:quinol monooxygenase YgiN
MDGARLSRKPGGDLPAPALTSFISSASFPCAVTGSPQVPTVRKEKVYASRHETDEQGSHRPIVEQEPATITWYAIKLGPSTFGIFDTFPDDKGRDAHLAGRVAAALMAKAPELLAGPPSIEKVEVLAAKLPG